MLIIKEKLNNFFKEKELAVGCCAALLGSMMVAYFSIGRKYFTFSTEVDYIARHLMDAQRLLNGEPLLLHFHPPFYSIILAPFQIIFQDWFTTGLVVSWISSTIVMVTSFIFFYHLGGRYAAWGSLLGLMSSSVFLTYSSFATSDVFFLALYSSCFLLTILAIQKKSITLWGLAGVILGCALLTRSNALTLIILLAFPWFQSIDFKCRLKAFTCIFVMCLIVLGTWWVAATLTGSPFWAKFGPVNLATRYFPTGGGDPFTFEARQQAISRFTSYKDVLLYDPKFMIVTFVKDFFQNLKLIFLSERLLPFPLGLFALPGIFIFFFKKKNIFTILFLIATISQFILLCFHEYEARYYIFLIPVLGAVIGFCLHNILESISIGWNKKAALIFFLPFLLSGMKEIRYSFAETYSILHAQDKEFGEIIPMAKKLVDPKGVIVSRGQLIPFYIGVPNVDLPDIRNLEDFRVWIENTPSRGPVYIYFGSDEKIWRPKLNELLLAKRAPDWIEPIAQSRSPNMWVLYRFKRVH